jgi:hypothetical protein
MKDMRADMLNKILAEAAKDSNTVLYTKVNTSSYTPLLIQVPTAFVKLADHIQFQKDQAMVMSIRQGRPRESILLANWKQLKGMARTAKLHTLVKDDAELLKALQFLHNIGMVFLLNKGNIPTEESIVLVKPQLLDQLIESLRRANKSHAANYKEGTITAALLEQSWKQHYPMSAIPRLITLLEQHDLLFTMRRKDNQQDLYFIPSLIRNEGRPADFSTVSLNSFCI